MRIKGIEKAVFSDDFSFMEVRLRTERPEPLTLEFATDTLQDGLIRVWHALQSAGTDALLKTNDSQSHIKVINAHAGSFNGGGVQISLVTEQGIELCFSMTIELSARLRRTMKAAEEESS